MIPPRLLWLLALATLGFVVFLGYETLIPKGRQTPSGSNVGSILPGNQFNVNQSIPSVGHGGLSGKGTGRSHG